MREAVKPLPIMDDPDTGGHFQAARDGQVAPVRSVFSRPLRAQACACPFGHRRRFCQ